jgi:tripartite-type tricarboxylate transporter receptor subunit TctC
MNTMAIPRRSALLLLPPLLAAPRLGRAAAFPERPIRLVVPYAAGGNSDVVARILAVPFGEVLGQPVVVENRPGAGGSVAATQMARVRADGYNLMIGSNGPMTVNPAIQPNPGYDPLRDFTPIGLICRTALTIIVKQGLPVRSLAEFVALARERPGQVTLGTSGVGSIGHLALARRLPGPAFRTRPGSGRELLHTVPNIFCPRPCRLSSGRDGDFVRGPRRKARPSRSG